MSLEYVNRAEAGFELAVRLFGPMEVEVGGKPTRHLRSRKGMWLLALLALRANRDVDRLWLAGTLWPDSEEPDALRSLRQSLHDLRAALGAEAWRLSAESTRTLRLDASGAFVDVVEFDRLTELPEPSAWESAVRLYRGALLEDCGEEWSAQERRRREHAHVGALERLAKEASQRGDHLGAATLLRTAVQSDPFREDLSRALMENLAAVGDTAAALQVYRDLRLVISREMGAAPSEATADLYRRIREDARRPPVRSMPAALPTANPRPAPPPIRPLSLPVPLTDLVGREADVREVRHLLSSSRLVTLTGVGGIGKTRLAVQTAAEVSADFEDVCFVGLAGLADGARLPDAVADALGTSRDEANREPMETLALLLSCHEVLLILDNCEHLASDCAALAQTLLTSCSGLRVLCTSRHALGVRGETVWRVPSLSLPPADDETDAESHERLVPSTAPAMYSAIQLFVERARAAESSFEMTPHNACEVLDICRRLDGIPLALELAAARVRSMSLAEISEQLRKGLGLLRGGGPTVVRHDTLSAAFQWSWDLLSTKERSLLARSAVFSGGWTLDAAREVCTCDAVDADETLELTSVLVDKSLVVYHLSNSQPTGSNRYGLLETIRQFAQDRLAAGGEDERWRKRHLDYYVKLACSASPHFTTADQGRWFALVNEEIDNIRAALGWCLSDERRAEEGLRLAGSLWRYWEVRGRIPEGRRWLDALLARRGGHVASEVLTTALHGAGVLAFRQGELARATEYHEEELEIQRTRGDVAGIAAALSCLGSVASVQCDYPLAEARLKESLCIERELGNLRGIAVVLNNLGCIACENGDYLTAKRLHEENLAIRREIGDVRGEAVAMSNLGNASLGLGEYESAGALFSDSLALQRGLGNQRGAAIALTNLGNVLLEKGDHGAALRSYAESLAIYQDVGDQSSVASTLESAGCVLSRIGRHSAAVRLWGGAAELRDRIGVRRPPAEDVEYRVALADAQAVLGPAAFKCHWFAGSESGVEGAVAIVSSATQCSDAG